MFLDKHFWSWMILKTRICFPVFLLFTLIVEPGSKIGIGGRVVPCSPWRVIKAIIGLFPLSRVLIVQVISTLTLNCEKSRGQGGAPRRASWVVKHGIVMS